MKYEIFDKIGIIAVLSSLRLQATDTYTRGQEALINWKKYCSFHVSLGQLHSVCKLPSNYH